MNYAFFYENNISTYRKPNHNNPKPYLTNLNNSHVFHYSTNINRDYEQIIPQYVPCRVH